LGTGREATLARVSDGGAPIPSDYRNGVHRRLLTENRNANSCVACSIVALARSAVNHFTIRMSKLFKNVPFITSFKMSPFCVLVRPLFLSLCPIPVFLEEFRARVS